MNPLDSLRWLIDGENYGKADSLYSDLISKTEYDTSNSLRLMGLELRLNKGFDTQCTDLLEDILGRTKKGSATQKTALGYYDKSLEVILAEAKSLESRGRYPEAITILEKMEPYRLIPASAARGNLLLQYSSVLLATNNPDGADSSLHLYLSAGYKKNAAYNNVDSRLTIVKNRNKVTTEPKFTQTAKKIEAKPQTKPEQYITLVPPEGDVIKVLVSSIDPISGQIQDNNLWETTGPLKLKTGTAYKLSVQRKHERKAPLFIAAAGVMATFFIVR